MDQQLSNTQSMTSPDHTSSLEQGDQGRAPPLLEYSEFPPEETIDLSGCTYRPLRDQQPREAPLQYQELRRIFISAAIDVDRGTDMDADGNAALLEYMMSLRPRTEQRNPRVSPPPNPDLVYYSPRAKGSVYTDTHNVHATSVATTVTKSIQNLLLDPKPDSNLVFEQVMHSGLSDSTKTTLTLFCQDKTLHVQTGLQYVDVLAYVWQRIQNPSITSFVMYDATDQVALRTELIRILEERVSDCIEIVLPVCFGGRLSRLVSTLDGFFSDIRITISDSERITAIVLQVKASLKPYDPVTHASRSTECLLEAGFEPDQFKDWITAIKEDDVPHHYDGSRMEEVD